MGLMVPVVAFWVYGITRIAINISGFIASWTTGGLATLRTSLFGEVLLSLIVVGFIAGLARFAWTTLRECDRRARALADRATLGRTDLSDKPAGV